MADKCTLFDQYPCDRLTEEKRLLDEALRMKAQYRDQVRGLIEENADLKTTLETVRQQRDRMGELVKQALETLGEVTNG